MKTLFGTLLIGLFAWALHAEARCTTRVGDPLITARYQECNTRTFLAYLYNDLVTPFSFTCAKKLSSTCRKENCEEFHTTEEALRCLSRYAEVLSECNQQIDDAAKMARCKDTKAWPVEEVAARTTNTEPPPGTQAMNSGKKPRQSRHFRQ